MKYRIISVGKIREPFFSSGIAEYLKRLGRYADAEIVDGLEEKINPHAGQKDIEKVLLREGQKILSLNHENDILVALDLNGQAMSSEELARHMQHWNQSGKARVNLVIGGANGLSREVRERADEVISFSRLTFPHQMAVLILAEQLYRGFKIIKGEPYHK